MWTKLRFVLGAAIVAVAAACAGDGGTSPQLGLAKTPLPAPTDLTAVAGVGSITLAWSDNSSNEGGFEVNRAKGPNGSYALVATTKANVVGYYDGGLGAGTQYCYKVRAKGSLGWAPSDYSNVACATVQAPPSNGVRIVTFGDSNTDGGWVGNSTDVPEHAYVSNSEPRMAPDANGPHQLAGKIEAQWRAAHAEPIRAVNHAISGTTSGGGGFGGSDRTGMIGSPNSRTVVNGATRYEAEVLGTQSPNWNGGEPRNRWYRTGPITRVAAYVPGANDFAYVSMGTNDPGNGIATDQTIANLAWMIDRWTAAGHRADHLMMTTLAPIGLDGSGTTVPTINAAIRGFAASKGITVIDLAAHVSHDDGLTWADLSQQVGDGVHYAEPVREWLAGQVVAAVSAEVAAAARRAGTGRP